MEGYQLIDLDSFEELTSQTDESLIILLLTWVILLVNEKENLTDIGELEIILSMYNGDSYPVLGVKYFSDDIDEITDIEPIIQEVCETMLQTKSIEDLLNFQNINFEKVNENRQKILNTRMKNR